MAHIHNKPGQYDHTVSALIVRLDFAEPKVLLHRHKILNKYLQIGGHIELDETPWQAIIHEIKEESGYDINQLKILQPKRRLERLTETKLHPYPISIDTHNFDPTHFHTDLKYAFTTKEKPKYALGKNESTDLRWFSRKEVNELTDKDTYLNMIEIINFLYDEVLKNWQAASSNSFIV